MSEEHIESSILASLRAENQRLLRKNLEKDLQERQHQAATDAAALQLQTARNENCELRNRISELTKSHELHRQSIAHDRDAAVAGLRAQLLQAQQDVEARLLEDARVQQQSLAHQIALLNAQNAVLRQEVAGQTEFYAQRLEELQRVQAAMNQDLLHAQHEVGHRDLQILAMAHQLEMLSERKELLSQLRQESASAESFE
ncbi:hypothetical protein SS50377_20827 [Spironucleus salmonicida]|uniref:Uncharacterized protein n=2 Tax=Spironucleus salmonicida TaxID=348837 RepID=A0A9P8S1P2_9EUKA|nr:hypothetical protein SS50377_20827 [Spironucleus salmonicida]